MTGSVTFSKRVGRLKPTSIVDEPPSTGVIRGVGDGSEGSGDDLGLFINTD